MYLKEQRHDDCTSFETHIVASHLIRQIIANILISIIAAIAVHRPDPTRNRTTVQQLALLPVTTRERRTVFEYPLFIEQGEGRGRAKAVVAEGTAVDIGSLLWFRHCFSLGKHSNRIPAGVV